MAALTPQDMPIYFSCLKQTRPIPDLADPSGTALAAAPAPIRVHAVHIADDQIVCGYARKPSDIAERDRDWFTVSAAEVPCKACRDGIRAH